MIKRCRQLNKGRIRIWTIVAILLFLGLFSLLFFKTSFTISRVVNWTNDAQLLPFGGDFPPLPEKDPNRINILLLGGRGANESGEGKLLSDTIIIVSIDKLNKKTALISIPRDLYVQLWCYQEKEKVNFAYAYGGLDCAKKTISYIIDLYIDYAVSVDFQAVEDGIDGIGGIDIYLDSPFEETFQWAKEGREENENWVIREIDGEEKWVFYVPAGQNHLDGATALYYVRSRYSTDDFNRMRRQQQVLMAIKDKAFSLGVLANPITIYNLLDVLGDNVKTDMSLSQIGSLINLVSNLDTAKINKLYFDTSPNGLLYHTFINDEYVLLPTGDNYDNIRRACKNIFD